MAAITHDAAKVSPKLQTYGDLRLQAYVTSSVCRAHFKDSTLCIIIALLVFSQEQLEHQQPFSLVHVRAVH